MSEDRFLIVNAYDYIDKSDLEVECPYGVWDTNIEDYVELFKTRSEAEEFRESLKKE